MIWHLFYMYGMYGPVTDPGARLFVERINDTLGINIHESPYRDFDVHEIVADILGLAPTDGVFIGGTSLGANNCPVVSEYLWRRDNTRVIAGAFGFQKSHFGVDVPFRPNTKFAHLFRSDNPLPFPGLGIGYWRATDNSKTNIYITQHDIPHPGDGDFHDQSVFIDEMKRIMEATK